MRCWDIDEFLLAGFPNRGEVVPIDVGRHLLQCESCRFLYRSVRFGYSSLRLANPETRVSPALRNRVLSMLRNCSWPDLAG
jgi:hypothetical protein